MTIADDRAGVVRPDADRETVLEVSHLEVTFPSEGGRVNAVRDVSYAVRSGEVLGIVGESGSGKSVSSLAVMGLLPVSARISGSVQLRGRELLGLGDKAMSRIRGKSIGMVFQDPLSALTPVYSIGAQIAEAVLTHRKVSKDDAHKRAIELLDLVGIPNAAQRAKAFPHEFSGGMRQRAVIAIAIANDPDLIIADEPTTALDVTIQAQVLEVLRTAQEVTGAAIIMITHDLGVVAGLADRVQVMYAGRIVESAPVNEIYYRPRMPYTMGLLGSIPRLDDKDRAALTPIEGNPPSLLRLPPGCPFAPRCPIAFDRCTEVEPALLPVGGEHHTSACHLAAQIESENLAVTDVFPEPEIPENPEVRIPRERRDEVLRLEGLVKEFPLMKGHVFKHRVGTVHAVDRIDIDMRSGETVALVGESGCGKTTTLLQILDLAKPQQGRIVVLGKDTAGMSKAERRSLRRDLQIVFQDPMASLDPRMPVGDILAEPLSAQGISGGRAREKISELLALVGLEPSHADRYPTEFSGGQRQRIGIARALALEPKLLVLDEPVSALDVSIQAGVINLLQELKGRLGLSYLFVAHDLSVVRHVADRIVVMYLGRVCETGTVNEVFDQPYHPYTQALMSAIPLPDPDREHSRRRIILEGDLPSPADPPSGCRFRTRCPRRVGLTPAEQEKCSAEEPQLLEVGDDHASACHYNSAASMV
ncbi:MAG: dipeptide ABC transporter ATP-binding protein [Mycobacteriales bacterium]